MSRARDTTPPPGLAAAWPGTCVRCGEVYEQGDRVVFQRGEYIHCRCAPGADDE